MVEKGEMTKRRLALTVQHAEAHRAPDTAFRLKVAFTVDSEYLIGRSIGTPHAHVHTQHEQQVCMQFTHRQAGRQTDRHPEKVRMVFVSHG